MTISYQDRNEGGLLEVHEDMDWADLFANRYNVLYDNVLCFACLQAMSEMATACGQSGAAYLEMAFDVRNKIPWFSTNAWDGE